MYLNKACRIIIIMIHVSEKLKRFSNVSKLAVDIAYLKYVKKACNRTLGRYTKEKFTSMGPTFIKIGQFISTRSDIFGKEFSNELKGLQDSIDPFEIDIKSYESEYLKINPQPIATASIGQVYTGVLTRINKDNTTSDVPIAVKIKRPNIDEFIRMDFDAFIFVVNVVNVLSNKREAMEFSFIVNEYYKLLLEEIDFKKEVRNIALFQKHFRTKGFVRVPRPFSDVSTDDMIVMEYLPSFRIDDVNRINAMNFDRKKIAEKLVELFLDQVINFGIIHIDPHPGNVGITERGKIVFYDYGMIQEIGIDFKHKLKAILLAVYEKDVEYLCKLLVESNIVIVEDNKLPYLKNFILVFISYIDNLNIDDFKKQYIDKVDKADVPFTISSKFLLILRGVSILEGVCKVLDPNFSYRTTIENYIDESIVDFDYIERKALMDIDVMRAMPDKITKNQIQLEIMEKNMEKMQTKVDPKKSLALLYAFALFNGLYLIEDNTMKVMFSVLSFVMIYK